MSEPEIIHPVPVDEVTGWLANLSVALLGDPHDADFDQRVARWASDWIPDRVWGVRDEGRWVGTLATDPRTMTIPGRDGTALLDVDALTGVSVSATHRRRGLLTAMLTRSLAAAAERGDAVSVLIAAEWPIYGRFGYAPCTQTANYTYASRHPAAAVAPSGTGRVRQVEAAEYASVAATVFDAARRHRAGELDRNELWWRRNLGLDGYRSIGKVPRYLIREGPGGADGLLAWAPDKDFHLDGRLGSVAVSELVAANQDAYRDLWAYLSGLDTVGEVELHQRPVDESARWLMSDGRALKQTYRGDWVWLRLLDVPVALSARQYPGTGRLVLDVVGDPLGYATGRFALDADEGGSACAQTSDAADLQLTHRALASAYLGGYRLAELVATGEVRELRAGALARADAMFGTGLAPANATGF